MKTEVIDDLFFWDEEMLLDQLIKVDFRPGWKGDLLEVVIHFQEEEDGSLVFRRGCHAVVPSSIPGRYAAPDAIWLVLMYAIEIGLDVWSLQYCSIFYRVDENRWTFIHTPDRRDCPQHILENRNDAARQGLKA